jgi:hypothetical protein
MHCGIGVGLSAGRMGGKFTGARVGTHIQTRIGAQIPTLCTNRAPPMSRSPTRCPNLTNRNVAAEA